MTKNFPMILNQMGILKFQIRNVTISFSKMRAKEERKQREEFEATLKLLKKKNFPQRKISLLIINSNKILQKYMIILRKEYASEVGVSGMKNVKKPLNFY